MIFDTDLHVHTCLSPCGKDEMLPRDIIKTAVDRGITRLAITDHFYPFTDLSTLDQVRADVLAACRRLNGSLKVFFGCEAEIMAPGKAAGSPDIARKLDFIMAGATHFQNAGITEFPKYADDHDTARYILDVFAYAVSLPWVDSIAHPFFVPPSVCSGEIVNLLQDSQLLPALESARQNNVAMEISRRVFHTPEQLRFARRFYSLCKQVGLKFTIGSDAHQLSDIGNVRILEPFIAELGLARQDFRLPESKTLGERLQTLG